MMYPCNWIEDNGGVICRQCGRRLRRAPLASQPCPAQRDEAERAKLVEPPPCLHRQAEVIEREPCTLCGMRDLVMPLYRCTLLGGLCAARRYRNRQTAHACSTCDERETE